MKKVLGCIRRACEDFHLIEDGDIVAVGVSGGKDSLLLLYALSLYRKFAPQRFELKGLTLTMGLEPFDTSKVAALCEKLGVEYIVRPTEIGRIIFEERHEKNPCSLCAKMRRGALNDLAKECGCNKVALGHHRDDALETLLLCLLHEGRIHTFHPKSYLSKADLTVIRPMVYLPEKHIIHVAREMQLPIIPSPCPANGATEREEMKYLLDSLCKLYPNAREMMLSALQNEAQYGLWNKN
jgi:tRNA(Ile)-lysidine synthase TilS/MesJ